MRLSSLACFLATLLGVHGAVRYNKVSLCETTPDTNAYSGYIDLDDQSHLFFWFFEARRGTETAPITLWLNGGPGTDSLLGLFTEVGPCVVNPDMTTSLNLFSWSETSNLLFLTQPVGVGFSYTINGTVPETSRLAAETVWQAVQAFLTDLPRISQRVKTRDFNLWTESYGGHYGPAFLRHFYVENELIKRGLKEGVSLNLKTLGVGNGIIDGALQFPQYPNFAVNNTYGIQALDDQTVSYMKLASSMSNGCRDQIYRCRQAYSSDQASIETRAICSRATNMCRDNVEGPYYEYSGRNMYDIRKSSQEPAYTDFFIKYLNLPSTQEALGLDHPIRYEPSSNEVYSSFQLSGDYVYPGYPEDIGFLLDQGIRVILSYGDADYIGNWFGGEAVSLTVNHLQAPFFRQSPYARLTIDGLDHGIVREHGNLSFAVIYDAGHMVPVDKPDVALEIFRRSLSGLDIATGTESVLDDSTVPFVPDDPIASSSPDALLSPSILYPLGR